MLYIDPYLADEKYISSKSGNLERILDFTSFNDKKLDDKLSDNNTSIIINSDKKSYEAILITDSDGTLIEYKKIVQICLKKLIGSSINSSSTQIKSVLRAVSEIIYPQLIKGFYRDTTELIEDLHPNCYTMIYTNNSLKVTEKLLKKYSLEDHFDALISTNHKDEISLIHALSTCTELNYETLKETPIIMLGDNRSDVFSFSPNVIKIGFDSGLEKKKEEFQKKCDIFIDAEYRITGFAQDIIYKEIKKILDAKPELKEKLPKVLETLNLET